MVFLESNPYVSLWNKYRPVILQLMSTSVNGPQQYKLYSHEFKAVGEKEKSGYSFSMQISKGKSLNSLKTSAVARNLLLVLQQSKRAAELTEEAIYEVSMDKHFVLHVTRKEEPKAEVNASAVTEGVTN